MDAVKKARKTAGRINGFLDQINNAVSALVEARAGVNKQIGELTKQEEVLTKEYEHMKMLNNNLRALTTKKVDV